MKLPFERMFAVGAFDALRTLRRESDRRPSYGFREIISILQATDASVSGLDFSAAVQLHSVVPGDVPTEIPHEFYRVCIRAVIVENSIWSKSITLGRARFLGQLSRDELFCFRAASLLDSPPPIDVVKWWDEMASIMRQNLGAAAMVRARRAEQLTLDHETERLRGLGISRPPQWTAIEDNTAGYDVLSFDKGDFGPTNRLIEVKSTIASPLRFFITRNEWGQALKFGPSYHFHIWDLTPQVPRLFERTVEQIAPHIPQDQKTGKWTNAEIPLGAT